jgi:hypothetical protein
MPVKRTQRTEVVGFALCAALCGIPAICIAGPAQDQAPAAEHKQQDRDKDRNAQDERKETRPGEARPRKHAAPSRQDHAAEAQPRNRSAEPSAQERQSRSSAQQQQSHSTGEREHHGAQAQHREQTAQGGTHRPAPNAHYQFRRQDTPRLRQHFQSQLARVDRSHRPHVVAGGSLSGSWQTYIVPVPVEEVTYLPPVPEGYQLGFYYGYIVVYDPYSGLVLDVIDLY